MATNKSKQKEVLTSSGGSIFKAYPQVNIPDDTRELQILKQQPEYQSALDKGVDGAWKKVPCNLVGLCILMQKNTDNLTYNNGVTIWFMDTLTVDHTLSKTFGTRYFYDNPNNLDGTFTGKEYMYSPYSNIFIRYDNYLNGTFIDSKENPDLPSFPELRPWANQKECEETTKKVNALMGQYHFDWWVKFECFIAILFDVDSDNMRYWAEHGVPPILTR